MEDIDKKSTEYDSEGLPEPIPEFYQKLLDVGVFPRAYDPSSQKLYEAAKIVHKHLCTLDRDYYTDVSGVKLIEFANAYAGVHSGLRLLEEEE